MIETYQKTAEQYLTEILGNNWKVGFETLTTGAGERIVTIGKYAELLQAYVKEVAEFYRTAKHAQGLTPPASLIDLHLLRKRFVFPELTDFDRRAYETLQAEFENRIQAETKQQFAILDFIEQEEADRINKMFIEQQKIVSDCLTRNLQQETQGNTRQEA
jgi:BMFP domain-containing protein YqiC